jgi:hypothetical protein
MKEEMLLKILDEIDAMTAEEYRDLFDESQKLPDPLPYFLPDPTPSPTPRYRPLKKGAFRADNNE